MRFKVISSLALSVIAAATLFVPHVYAQETARRIEIVAKRFNYTPGEITLKKGEPVVIVFTSQDTGHGLKFKELNLTVQAKKGETKEVPFTPTQAGTFVGQCSVFCGTGHGGMKMTLHVTE